MKKGGGLGTRLASLQYANEGLGDFFTCRSCGYEALMAGGIRLTEGRHIGGAQL